MLATRRAATGLAGLSPSNKRVRLFSSCSSATSWQRPGLSALARLPIDIHPEVAAALQASQRGPVVALESTLITHGLPLPAASDLPKACEKILRDQGVTPATIAVLDGRIKVGLETSDLERLAEMGAQAKKDKSIDLWKIGRRELGAALTKHITGGTTVSATMAVAHMAGIKIFSTGGIGGVSRGGETTFDISSDLISLADTPVAVVCAGSKSIMDIGLTLEYLEAHAVPVAAYGTSAWPAFYTPDSGFAAPMQLNDARQVAETIAVTERMGLPSALLLGVPIPEDYHASGHALQQAVEQAVKESFENGIYKTGKAVTPWLLQRVSELTKGSSVESNKALILNNVKVGGEIAVELARVTNETQPCASFLPHSNAPVRTESAPVTPTSASLVVVGSLAVDITMVPTSVSPLATTAPGRVSLSLGGVAGNVARAAHSIGVSDVLLVAPAANDTLGNVARDGLTRAGVRTDGLISMDSSASAGTPTCGILLDERGDLVGGVADMKLALDMEGAQVVKRIKAANPKLVCFDGNISVQTMASLVEFCSKNAVKTFFETTSNAQSLKLVDVVSSRAFAGRGSPPEDALITYSAPNIHELATLYQHIRTLRTPSDEPDPRFQHGLWFDYITVQGDLLTRRMPEWVVNEGVVQMAVSLLPVIGTLFIKSGGRGVLVVQRVSGQQAVEEWRMAARNQERGLLVAVSTSGPEEAVVIRHFPAVELPESEVISVTGAGDNLAGAMLACMSRGLNPSVPHELEQIVEIGQRAAVQTLKSPDAVGDHVHLRDLLPASG